MNLFLENRSKMDSKIEESWQLVIGGNVSFEWDGFRILLAG
ncbi:hypothetical protein [Leptospira borgpetersenii]|uniref:Uncharacterized protein n=5 Tax=Leptospira borgpetersenii TaxID=174 RepID=M3FJX8_LEPBO|nr:hypothetical protein [Leptospira borgpetersenii]EKP14512.1 hypothetical protein LEP1GSC128_1522 [Leptospira borgpetersenii str. 200801926]EKQ92348.1 hypothetical protein LEP1GSC101_2829 [Leptospira borgpetersenii str. UI 09149]EMG02133.1 hypothetical protein LEP1GSC123_2693 [Leptospira borgpetersenii str. 200701203]EMK12428.1 hypothetical protein LEP1GSC066_3278 [Leptospira sp. serovar Kenya str. Sh9]EMN57987.1 hypothetical protein LEP1GSC090_3713 [Leptospira borgpetersenii serovar Javanica